MSKEKSEIEKLQKKIESLEFNNATLKKELEIVVLKLKNDRLDWIDEMGSPILGHYMDSNEHSDYGPDTNNAKLRDKYYERERRISACAHEAGEIEKVFRRIGLYDEEKWSEGVDYNERGVMGEFYSRKFAKGE